MPKFKVLLTDYAWPDVDVERGLLEEAGGGLLVADSSDTQTLARLAADVDGILTCWAQTTAEVMRAAPKLRVISRLGVGLDNIDIAAATRHGVIVTNVPDYCRREVAEHTLALLLALARKVAFYHQQTKLGHYEIGAGPPLRRLAGQTLGVVGYGSIGQEVAALARAFGLRVAVASRTRREAPGTAWRDLPDLLAESDYVSLHVPLTEETRGLIGAEALAGMKPTAYLINTARGALIDHAALAEALQQGKLAGAALDVQDPEPPDLARPPFSDPRVIVTPHAAFASQESLLSLRSQATRQLLDALAGRQPANVVNPEVL